MPLNVLYSQITSYTFGRVTVDGVSVVLSSVTVLDGASFVVRGEGMLSVPNATSYDGLGVVRDRVFRAEGAGSVLDLSQLTMVRGVEAVCCDHESIYASLTPVSPSCAVTNDSVDG